MQSICSNWVTEVNRLEIVIVLHLYCYNPTFTPNWLNLFC